MTLNEFKQGICICSRHITQINVTDIRGIKGKFAYDEYYSAQQFFDTIFPDTYLMDEGGFLFIHDDMLQIYIRIEDVEV